MIRRRRIKCVARNRGVKLKPPRAPPERESGSEVLVSESHLASCPFCITKFQTKWHVKWHIRHKHWPKYKRRIFCDTLPRCEICGRTYLNIQYLATHLNHAHATRMHHLRLSEQSADREFYCRYNRFHCDTCGDTFMEPYRYEGHMERGHVFKRSVGLLHCDTKYRGVNQFFTREHKYLSPIQVSECGTRLCRVDRGSILAKKALVAADRVERYETIF